MNPTRTLLLAAALLAVTGCNTTPDRARAICPQVESIAQRTAQRVLASNDNQPTRAALTTAAATLEQASADATLDFNDLAELLGKLPFRDLAGDDARLIIDGATLAVILLFPDGAAVDVSDYESARVIAACLAAGLRTALQP